MTPIFSSLVNLYAFRPRAVPSSLVRFPHKRSSPHLKAQSNEPCETRSVFKIGLFVQIHRVRSMVIINNLYPEVIKTCRPLIVEDEVLKSLTKKISESIARSLASDQSGRSTIKCNLTHVTDFPDGTEKGSFIGLDFSGRIFRLVHVALRGDRSYTTITKLYEFPDEKPTGGVVRTGDYVAKCVNNFLDTYSIYEKKTILGVASTFPMEQETLQEAKILNWNNEFVSNPENEDFFTQLKVSLKKYKLTKRIYLISLVSNATACLLSGLYRDPLLRIGLFLGDNTNLTYIEKFKNMTAYTGDGLRTRTAVDVGLKNFGDDGVLDFIRTEFDFDIDAASKNPGQFVLEKLTSASYLGEIARLCLYKLVSMGVILNGYISTGLSTKDSLKTSDLALMEMDDEKRFTRCRAVMYNLGYTKVSESDCIQIRFVSRCVARRSSNLIAACLTAMIHRMESRDVRIIGDGMLLKDFPNYEYYLVKKINQLKKPEVRYLISKGEKEDVGVGAGLVAHIYRDGFIKLEDKHRVLPPFNANKYNLKEIPASFIDCECKSSRTRANVEKSGSVASQNTKNSSFISSTTPESSSLKGYWITKPGNLNSEEILINTLDYK